MKSLLRATITVLTLAAAARAQNWQAQVNEHGLRTAQVSASGNTPDGPATTTLTVQCAPAKNGTVSLLYSIDGTAQIKRFNFADFEGPGAPASQRKLVTVEVKLPARSVLVQTAVAGYYVAADTFVFSFSAPRKIASQVTRVTDAIKGGAQTITFTVQDSRARRRVIQTIFPAAGAATAIAETMKGCGK